ncbi:ABC transporter ATP-binding protein/permease [Streptomyces sp. PTM05]|uniref:ABC transporter ATP-binding protein/permease n=1 Tax=Streptantibioticus parmotrematis TaxID=2873249 RepID=A0ABS7QLG3_9ACTN|nr:ABC transporter ATP-binding protein [Streptantibioticus parmotrematis]MBY8884018.1 ABC transporter ATP-binding protein/permease [Streptantibioticus parmotrematis]
MIRPERPGPQGDSGVGRTDVWRRVLRLFRPHRRQLALSLLIVAIISGLNASSPVLLRAVINDALPHCRTGLLAVLCVLMILAGMLAGGLSILLAAINNRTGQRIVHTLRTDLYGAMQEMPLDYFGEESTAEIQARLASDIGGVSDVMTFAAHSLLGGAATFVTSAVVMLYMSWPIGLASVVLSLALNLLNNRFARKRRRLAREQQSHVARMLQISGEHLSLAGVIIGRTLAREDWQRDVFERASSDVRDKAIRQRLAGRTALALIAMTLACLPACAYWAAGTVLPGLSLGAVVVLTTLQTRLSTPIQQLLQVSAEIQSSAAMFERIFAYLDLPRTRRRSPRAALTRPRERPGSIRLDGVGYGFPGSGRRVLDGFSATIHAGSRTFVMGESGAGKSTLGLVISGLVQPDAGEISVRPPDGPRTASLCDHVTLVPQEAVLSNATIRENLLFARPDADDADIAKALETVCLSGLVAGLTLGLQAPVGERGAQLSGGERQRLALARSLLAGYPVMVMDETLSGVDSETAEQIYRNLDRDFPGRTLIFITHRLPEALPGSDLIVMAKGAVGYHGTRDRTTPPAPQGMPAR